MPAECDECLQANELGGAGTALIIGAVALVGYLLFAKRAEAKTAAAPAACAIDPQKLDHWGEARGFPIVVLLARSTPPATEELRQLFASRLAAGEQGVVVLEDGSFWYYINEPQSTGRADNLRADYCSFPDAPPPQIPPPAPQSGTPQGLGQPRTELWAYTARQFLYWDAGSRTWKKISEQIAPYPPGNLSIPGGYVADWLRELTGIDPWRYKDYWLAVVDWVWLAPPNPNPGWYFYNTEMESPQAPQPGSGSYGGP
jgi:hypothetical protein